MYSFFPKRGKCSSTPFLQGRWGPRPPLQREPGLCNLPQSPPLPTVSHWQTHSLSLPGFPVWGSGGPGQAKSAPGHQPPGSPAPQGCRDLALSGFAVTQRAFLGKHHTLIHWKINQNDTSCEQDVLAQQKQTALYSTLWRPRQAPGDTRGRGKARRSQQRTCGGPRAGTGPGIGGRGLPCPSGARAPVIIAPSHAFTSANDLQMPGPSVGRHLLCVQGLGTQRHPTPTPAVQETWGPHLQPLSSLPLRQGPRELRARGAFPG